MKRIKNLLKYVTTSVMLLCCCLMMISCSDDVREINEEAARLKGFDIEYDDMYLLDSVEGLIADYEKLSESQKNKIEDKAFINEIKELLPVMQKYASITVKSVKKFLSVLKDAGSVIYTDNYITSYGILEDNYFAYKINYNAKNSFGAYTGKSTSYVVYKKIVARETVEVYESSESYLFMSMGLNPETLSKDERIVEGLVTYLTLEDIQAGEYDK